MHENERIWTRGEGGGGFIRIFHLVLTRGFSFKIHNCIHCKKVMVSYKTYCIMVRIPKVTLLVFCVLCVTFYSNQFEECECVMEFSLTYFNVLIQGLAGYDKFNSGQNQTLSRSRTK